MSICYLITTIIHYVISRLTHSISSLQVFKTRDLALRHERAKHAESKRPPPKRIFVCDHCTKVR